MTTKSASNLASNIWSINSMHHGRVESLNIGSSLLCFIITTILFVYEIFNVSIFTIVHLLSDTGSDFLACTYSVD